MKTIFFLDMDGVLADFVGHAARHFDVDLRRAPRCYDLSRVLGVSHSEIHDELRDNADFWSTIPVLPWAVGLRAALHGMGRLLILTTPWPQSDVSIVEKRLWCYLNFGLAPEHVLFSTEKRAFAVGREDHVLIDDHEDNCRDWAAAGGRAPLFPARHNELYAELAKPPHQLLTTFLQYHFPSRQ